IEFMMGGAEKKEERPQRNPFFFNPFGMGRDTAADDESRKFRVDADVENNRLLLWANEVELQEVHNLLVKLGELPPAGGNQNTVRIIDDLPADEAEELLERIRRIWPNVRPNPLKIAPPALPADDADRVPPK